MWELTKHKGRWKIRENCVAQKQNAQANVLPWQSNLNIRSVLLHVHGLQVPDDQVIRTGGPDRTLSSDVNFTIVFSTLEADTESVPGTLGHECILDEISDRCRSPGTLQNPRSQETGRRRTRRSQ